MSRCTIGSSRALIFNLKRAVFVFVFVSARRYVINITKISGVPDLVGAPACRCVDQ
jgi:hypothetical protein